MESRLSPRSTCRAPLNSREPNQWLEGVWLVTRGAFASGASVLGLDKPNQNCALEPFQAFTPSEQVGLSIPSGKCTLTMEGVTGIYFPRRQTVSLLF